MQSSYLDQDSYIIWGWSVRVVVAGRWMELQRNKIVHNFQSVKTVSLFLIHIVACTVLASVPGSPLQTSGPIPKFQVVVLQAI